MSYYCLPFRQLFSLGYILYDKDEKKRTIESKKIFLFQCYLIPSSVMMIFFDDNNNVSVDEVKDRQIDTCSSFIANKNILLLLSFLSLFFCSQLISLDLFGCSDE